WSCRMVRWMSRASPMDRNCKAKYVAIAPTPSCLSRILRRYNTKTPNIECQKVRENVLNLVLRYGSWYSSRNRKNTNQNTGTKVKRSTSPSFDRTFENGGSTW